MVKQDLTLSGVLHRWNIYLNGEKQTEIVNSMPGGGGAPGGGPQGMVAWGPAPDGRP